MEVSRTASQTLATNDYIIFNDNIVIPPSRCMYYNQNTGITTLNGKTSNGNCYAIFKVTFTANLSSTAANTPASLAIVADGSEVAKSEMTVTSTAIGDTYSVCRIMYIKVPKGMSTTVGVQSSATVNETVTDAILIIERIS